MKSPTGHRTLGFRCMRCRGRPHTGGWGGPPGPQGVGATSKFRGHELEKSFLLPRKGTGWPGAELRRPPQHLVSDIGGQEMKARRRPGTPGGGGSPWRLADAGAGGASPGVWGAGGAATSPGGNVAGSDEEQPLGSGRAARKSSYSDRAAVHRDGHTGLFILFLINLFIYLLLGCVGSSLLHAGFL